MTYSISVAEAAEKDIREAFLYYEDQKDNLGSSFENLVNKAVDSIQSNPLKTQIRYGNTRVFLLKKFPYGIHFQIDENHLLIVAVFHTSQDPEKWTER
ncbi:MAG: plasmid stabilization system protein ParE [Cyclobacteriaceae bacterium]|jgi:plasmid stabilization system protein ParE